MNYHLGRYNVPNLNEHQYLSLVYCRICRLNGFALAMRYDLNGRMANIWRLFQEFAIRDIADTHGHLGIVLRK